VCRASRRTTRMVCVEACRNVLQSVAVCHIFLRWVAGGPGAVVVMFCGVQRARCMLQCAAASRSVLRWTAVCCSALQCVAVRCSVLRIALCQWWFCMYALLLLRLRLRLRLRFRLHLCPFFCRCFCPCLCCSIRPGAHPHGTYH